MVAQLGGREVYLHIYRSFRIVIPGILRLNSVQSQSFILESAIMVFETSSPSSDIKLSFLRVIHE